MTDPLGIFSTTTTMTNIHGKTVIKERDSLVAEMLLSMIIGITILSCVTFVKFYISIINVGMYPAYALLLVPLIQMFIRRARINNLFLIIILNLLVSAAAFFVYINIPGLGFDTGKANAFYLALILIAFALFSIIYRVKPTFYASDQEMIVFPAFLHLAAYLLYAFSGVTDLARDVIINALICAVIFLIMRQLALFDAKYYHSIHKISKSSSTLKKQNYKTVAGLIGIVVVAFGVLTVFPYEFVNKYLLVIGRGIAGIFAVLRVFFANRDFTYKIEPGEVFQEEFAKDLPADDSSLSIIAKIVFILVSVILILLILNVFRIIINNLPKITKTRNLDDDDKIIDSIEDIRPEKRMIIAKQQDFGTGYERRVRKRFYDKTRRAIRKGLPVSDASTPGQIENVLMANGDNEIGSLRQEYEKVRYGKEKS